MKGDERPVVDGKVMWDVTVSLDGYIARPDGSPGRIFDWYYKGDTRSKFYSDQPPFKYPFKLTEDDAKIFDEVTQSIGAVVTGRHTYDSTKGWHGSFYIPVPMFVVTHTPPQAFPEGPTKFVFVTDGIKNAVKRAKDAAGGKAVNLLGANTAKQCIEHGLLDELRIHMAPFFLGDGVRLFDHPGSQQVEFERISTIGSSSGWTHLVLRMKNPTNQGSFLEKLRTS